MSDIKEWSSSAGGNTAASPNGAPEGMAPSGVNDTIRENMAAIRRMRDDAEWHDHGLTPSFATTGTFTLAGDRTSIFHVGRRIKAYDSSNEFYGTITDTTYSASTRVSVSLDSGEFTASLTAVAVGILSFTNKSVQGFALLSATNTFAAPNRFGAEVAFSATVSFASKVNMGAGLLVSGTASFVDKVVFTGEVVFGGETSSSATASFVAKPVFENGIKVGGASEFSATVTHVSKVVFKDGMDVSGTAVFTGAIAISGHVKNLGTVQTSAVDTSVTAMPHDDSVPLSSEGEELFVLTVTPTLASSMLRVMVSGTMAVAAADKTACGAVFKDAEVSAIGASATHNPTADRVSPFVLDFEVSASSTTARVYKFKYGAQDTSTVSVNGSGGVRKFGGVSSFKMSVDEIFV